MSDCENPSDAFAELDAKNRRPDYGRAAFAREGFASGPPRGVCRDCGDKVGRDQTLCEACEEERED